MESTQDFLNIVSALITVFPFFQGISASKAVKKRRKDTILQSLVITLFIILVFPIILQYSFESEMEFYEALLVLYAAVSLALFCSKKLSNKTIEICKINKKEWSGSKTAVCIIFFIFLSLGLGTIVFYSKFFGVNVKFTEDVIAQFVSKDNSVYKVRIPKDTVVILNEDDIIQNDLSVKTGMNDLKISLLDNKILFKVSKLLPMKSNVKLYLAREEYYNCILFIPQIMAERKDCFSTEHKFNLDLLNSENNTVKFLQDTKFELKNDADVVLLQDTIVEVREVVYKYLIYLIVILNGVFIIILLCKNLFLLYKKTIFMKILIVKLKLRNWYKKLIYYIRMRIKDYF